MWNSCLSLILEFWRKLARGLSLQLHSRTNQRLHPQNQTVWKSGLSFQHIGIWKVSSQFPGGVVTKQIGGLVRESLQNALIQHIQVFSGMIGICPDHFEVSYEVGGGCGIPTQTSRRKLFEDLLKTLVNWWPVVKYGGFQKYGYPKMDGENNGKPYKNGLFGGTTI